MTDDKASVARDKRSSQERCRQYRKRILEMSQEIGALHIAPAFSSLEIVDVVYNEIFPAQSLDADTGTFLMSKGHGYVAQLVVLEDLGVISDDDLRSFCTPGGILGGHPDLGTPGIKAATGSLGHGLGIGLGMAIADRNLARDTQEKSRSVFVLISDGELQEGSTWESILLASSLGITNLVLIVDNNDFQSLGRTSKSHASLYPLADKFVAFGWEVQEADGHDAASLVQVIERHSKLQPLAIVAKTTKGKGVSFMEDAPIWHYRSPNSSEYEQALSELEGGTS